jgi:hypothetical protein
MQTEECPSNVFRLDASLGQHNLYWYMLREGSHWCNVFGGGGSQECSVFNLGFTSHSGFDGGGSPGCSVFNVGLSVVHFLTRSSLQSMYLVAALISFNSRACCRTPGAS